MPGIEDFPELSQALETAHQNKKENRKFLERLRKKPPKNLDQEVHQLDAGVWQRVDCLDCANCCKTLSPIFKQKDIERIARRQGMKPGEFIENYLRLDEDGDYVLQKAPCPFLGDDNYCGIYEYRPAACADYPHLHHRKWHQHIRITQQNMLTCPAAAEVVEALKKVFP